MSEFKKHLEEIAITVVAIYPILVLTLLFLAPLLENINFYLRTFILVLLLVSLMRFVMLPIINKILRKLK